MPEDELFADIDELLKGARVPIAANEAMSPDELRDEKLRILQLASVLKERITDMPVDETSEIPTRIEGYPDFKISSAKLPKGVTYSNNSDSSAFFRYTETDLPYEPHDTQIVIMNHPEKTAVSALKLGMKDIAYKVELPVHTEEATLPQVQQVLAEQGKDLHPMNHFFPRGIILISSVGEVVKFVNVPRSAAGSRVSPQHIGTLSGKERGIKVVPSQVTRSDFARLGKTFGFVMNAVDAHRGLPVKTK